MKNLTIVMEPGSPNPEFCYCIKYQELMTVDYFDKLEYPFKCNIHFVNDDGLQNGDVVYDTTNKDTRIYYGIDPENYKKVVISSDVSLNLPRPSEKFKNYLNSKYGAVGLVSEEEVLEL